jgi:valyl-tRNA synthetase
MPFVSESIWQALGEAAFERGLPAPEPAAESVCIAPWPDFPTAWADPAMEARIARMQALVTSVREVRERYTLNKNTSLDVFVRCSNAVAADLKALAPFIGLLAGVGKLECGPDTVKPRQSSTVVHPDFEAYVSLAGLIDVAAEVKRLEKQLADKVKHLHATWTKLGNSNFVDKAPAEVVQQQRDLVTELQGQIKAIEDNLLELRQG